MKKEDVIFVLRSIGIANVCIKDSESWVSAPCPLAEWTHAKGRDSRASFGISINEDGPSGYNCLSCGEHGNVRGLVERLSESKDVDYTKLLDFVDEAETVTTFPPWEERSKVVEFPEPLNEDEVDELFDPAAKVRKARDYFRSRHLPIDLMVKYDLRWDDYRNRILFKVKRDGLLYGMSGRSVLPKPKNKVRVYHHKKSLFLVGEEHLVVEDTDRPIVVIEGLMGLIELDSCSLDDYADAVALQGRVMSIAQRDRLVEIGRPVILFLDNDKAGMEGTYGKVLSNGRKVAGALEMLTGLVDVKVAKWPDGINDFPELTNKQLRQIVMKTWSFLD